MIAHEDSGIILTPFDASQFTILFWFYLENNTNVNLITLIDKSDGTLFKLTVEQGR